MLSYEDNFQILALWTRLDLRRVVFDRNKNNEVGLEENYKPQVWRVYKRKRGKGMKDDELAKRVMRST